MAKQGILHISEYRCERTILRQNIKCLWWSLNTQQALAMCVDAHTVLDTHRYTVVTVMGINENEK